MKHAKPSISRPNFRVIGVALLAVAFIAAFFGMLNVRANDTATPTTQWTRGTTATCTLSNSRCILAHGLGVTPTSIVAIPYAPGQSVTLVAKNATTYELRFLWHNGTQLKAGTVVKFDVLFSYVGTATPPPTTTPSPTPTSTPTLPEGACKTPVWSSSEKLGSHNFDANTQVNNNMHNAAAGPQTIAACSASNWYVVSNQPGDGDNDGVKTYPDTQQHVNYPMNQLPEMNTHFKVATPSAGGVGTGAGKQWNAAYDLWLDNFDHEVMVWTNWNANWKYWYDTYKGEMVTLDGVTYAAWHKPATTTSASGTWFVRQDVTNEGSFNLTTLLNWAKNKGWLKSTSTLQEIEYGFEIFYTGTPTRFDLLDYSVRYVPNPTNPTPTPTPTVTPTPTPTPTAPPTNINYTCNPTNTVAHFYPSGSNTTGQGSDAIGDAQPPAKWGQFNASAEHWAVNDDFRSNMCVYSKDKWYLEAKSVNDGGMVQAYPSMRKIYHDWGKGGDYSGDPKLSSFPQLKAEVAVTDPANCTGCIYNDAFDIWLNGIAGTAPELMIWTHNYGQTPYGPKKASNITVDGRQWDLYNSGSYIAYVPTNNDDIKSGTYDIKKFVGDLVARGIVPADPKVSQLSYGVEVVATGKNSSGTPLFRRWDFTKFNVMDN